MRKPRVWLLACAALAALTLVPAGSSAQQQGTSVIFGAEQDIDCMNPILDACNQFWGSVMVYTPTLAGLYEIQPNFTFKPDLVQSVRVRNRPFSVRYRLKAAARWSDGRPITVNDFRFTLRWIMDPNCEVAGTEGYRDIRRISGRGKNMTFHFRRPYTWWRTLFTDVLPEHALRGENCNRTWQSGVVNPKAGNRPIGSGPYIFSSYNAGQQLTIVRNNRYWGSPRRARISRITFRFLQNTSTEIQQMRGGEVDAIYPQPQLELAPLRRLRSLGIQSNAGATWEHIDVQTSRNHPALRRKFVRQALIQAINRDALTRGLFRTLNPRLRALHNTQFVSNSPYYRPNWNVWKFNQQAAIDRLRRNRCTGGPRRPGQGGVYTCPGVGRLSFEFVSTAGNRLRELAFEIIQQQVRRVGIELRSGFRPAAIAFGQRLTNKQFDLFMFAWVESGVPAGKFDLYGCGGESNYMDYCNRRVTSLLRRASQQLTPRAASTFHNRADRLISADVPTIPLYQKPTYLVYKRQIRNMRDNPTLFGPTFNAEVWAR